MATSHLSCIDIKGRGKKEQNQGTFFFASTDYWECYSTLVASALPSCRSGVSGGIISPTERQSQRVKFTLLNSLAIISAALKVNWFY